MDRISQNTEEIRLLEARQKSQYGSFPEGCTVVSNISNEHISALRSIHESILTQTRALVPWGCGWKDKRERGYGMIPSHSKWNTKRLQECGVVMEEENGDGTKHVYTYANSFCDLELSPSQLEAIEAVIAAIKTAITDSSWELQDFERDCVSIADLVSLQPNLHNGEFFLPLHLDSPRHDGFGVVIVTVALVGSGDVVIVDDGDDEGDVGRSWAFPVKQGDVYVLCGHARNKCTHGVLAAEMTEGGEGVAPGLHTSRGGASAMDQQGCAKGPGDRDEDIEVRDGERKRRREWEGGSQQNSSPGSSSSSSDKDSEVKVASQRARRSGRETLNFRFGVHTVERAYEYVDRHWV
jgi:hypothetical protein